MLRKLHIALLAFTMLLGTPALAGADTGAEVAKMQAKVHKRASKLKDDGAWNSLRANMEPVYVSVGSLRPTQNRVSFLNAWTKLPEKGRKAKHDGGRSFVAAHDAKDAVIGPDGVYLLDGHHNVLASLHAGARSFPVRIMADMRQMPKTQFWRHMETRGWAYLRDLSGKRRIPKGFGALQDDPNRYFAAAIARKVRVGRGGKRLADKGHKHPVWVKSNGAPPFVEFHIADALYAAGVRYENKLGTKPPKGLVERARVAVVSARNAGRNQVLRSLPVLSERKPWKQVKLERVLAEAKTQQKPQARRSARPKARPRQQRAR